MGANSRRILYRTYRVITPKHRFVNVQNDNGSYNMRLHSQ